MLLHYYYSVEFLWQCLALFSDYLYNGWTIMEVVFALLFDTFAAFLQNLCTGFRAFVVLILHYHCSAMALLFFYGCCNVAVLMF